MKIVKLKPSEMGSIVADQLAELFDRRAWPKGFYPYRPLTKSGWWLNEGRAALRSGNIVSFVAVEKDRIIGHAALVNHRGFWESGRWAIDPAHQGKGVGNNLVATSVEWAKQQKVVWFVVGCSYYQRFSELICRRLGMKFLGIKPDIYQINGAVWGETLFLWQKEERWGRQLTKELLKRGTVGLWPDSSGEWKRIFAQELPTFELARHSCELKGKIAVHTTAETWRIMKNHRSLDRFIGLP